MQIGAGKSEGSSSNAKMIVIVVVAVVVVLLLLALVPVVRLYRKAQVLEERLQYEMQDVRNIAGVNGGDAARGYVNPLVATDRFGGCLPPFKHIAMPICQTCQT